VVGPATLAGLDVTALGWSREALLVLGFLTGRRVSRAGGGKPDCSRIVRILANKRRYSRRNIGEEVREGREDDARGVGGTLPEEAPTLDMETFASYEVEELGAYMGEERKRLGEPSWKPLDRGSVEALVGEPLDQ
jgi:hypothetical protein